jgi:hypothetical protein
LHRFLVSGAGLLAFDDDFDMRASLRNGVGRKAEYQPNNNYYINDATRLGPAVKLNSQI